LLIENQVLVARVFNQQSEISNLKYFFGAAAVMPRSKSGRWRGRGGQECPPHTNLVHKPAAQELVVLA
jgi:hypothetical protein